MQSISHPSSGHIGFYGPKGGQGTSTVAAATALFASRLSPRVSLRSHDCVGMARLLALPAQAAEPADVAASITLSSLESNSTASAFTVDDLGRAELAHRSPAHTSVMVLRPCYLALEAAVRAACEVVPDWLVVVAEPDRSIGPADIAAVLAIPVAAVVPLDPAVARTLDAGMLVPSLLTRSAARRCLAPLKEFAGRLTAGIPSDASDANDADGTPAPS